MKKFLRFEEMENIGKKTKVYDVYSTHSDDFLGSINWDTGWRQYVFSPDMTKWSVGCLRQLADFVETLNMQQKQSHNDNERNETNRQ